MSSQNPPSTGDSSWQGGGPDESTDPRWRPPPEQQAPSGWGPDQYGRQPDPYGQAPVAPSGATTALVLGICGIVVLPLILSIPAWIIGKQARDEAERLPGRPGWSTANVGYILGIIGTLLGVFGILLFLFVIGSFFSIASVVDPSGLLGLVAP